MAKLKMYVDGAWVEVANGVAGGSGASTFLDLTDTPSAFTGQAGKVATVNTGETALEFTAASGGGLTTGYRAEPSSTTSVATGTAVGTKIVTDTSVIDINSEHSTTKWVCKDSGTYHIHAQCRFETGSTGMRVVLIIKNATTTGTPPVYATGTILGSHKDAVSSGVMYPETSCIATLTANDVIEMFVMHSQGANLVCGSLDGDVSMLEIFRIN